METIHTLGKTSEIPEGYSKCYEVEDRRIAVFNVEGHFFAIDDACPHAGAPLSESEPEDLKVTCYWHGATFNLQDGKCTVQGEFPDVEAYPVQIDNGEIQIKIT